MAARNFVWIFLGGGAWSLGSNWADMTDGSSPSLLAPGAQDSVTVSGPTGAALQTISGGGQAAAALFAGNTLLTGAYTFGSVALGGGGGLLELGSGALLQAGSANLGSGSVLVGGAGRFAVGGMLALGTSGVAGASLDATGGSTAVALAMMLNDAADSIYVDASSIVEVGSAGNARAGALTVDTGGSITGQGSANAYGNVVNNGTLMADGGTLAVGTLSGSGSLVIDAGATLALNGACGAGQSVAFAGANATLAIDEAFFAPAGTLTGFAAGDAIDMRGSTISAASFTPSGNGTGVLNLFYGTQLAAHLTLSGDYTAQSFLLAGDGAGGTLVTVAPNGGGGGKASPGTSTPDQYVWRATGSGAWNAAANWRDVTTGASPASVAPGRNDLVSVQAAQDGFTVIGGPANAAALALTGEVALSGAYAVGTLTIGQATGFAFTDGTLDLLSGTSLAAASAGIQAGAVSISGSAASLSVAGTLLLGGGVAGVGLPIASLSATAGGTVQAAALAMGGGSGATITTDTTGMVEIGTAGGAAAGAVTIDAGAQLGGNGRVNPFGSIIDNGSILATGGTLTLGSVGGTGTLAVDAGATLELMAATGVGVQLQGSAATAPCTLAIANERAMPTGTLAGWAVGDAIHLEGSTLTGVQFIAAQSGSGGTLLLFYGQVVVARLAIGGSLAGMHFVLSPDGSDGTFVTLVSNSAGGGGSGQTGTDQLSWSNASGGNWSRATNWTDTTLNKPATLPPGAQTPVQIAGPGGAAFQSIAGTGSCASLSLTGNTVLSGSFTSGAVNVGNAGTSTQGTLELGPATSLTALQGGIGDGALICIGNGALLTISGTLALGGAAPGVGQPDALLAASGRAGAQLGGLTLGGGESNAVTVDSTAWIEIGSAGGAANGALTIDAGATASGNGTLNTLGSIIDNGSIIAQGGTLLVGSVAGGGVLDIGTEATLALQAGDTCPIAFTGGGATLILPGAAQLPSGIVSGFAAGDSIVTRSAVDGVGYQQGAGNVGTLSLTQGGVACGQILLAGDFAGESFAAVPEGNGSAIIVQGLVNNGPPAGTATPDAYRWSGAGGGLAWSNAANWVDVTQGSAPAAVAPGQNDQVTIAGGNGAVLAIAGPADAASLSLSGTVALSGLYAIGQLNVGSVQAAALLAVQGGTSISAGNASVIGGLALQGGSISVVGTLALGQAGGAAGLVGLAGSATLSAGCLLMAGAGSSLSSGSTGSIEIGGTGTAAPGSITIDAGRLLQGAGSVGLGGATVDQGTICASGGTLLLGSVSGSGTLLVGTGADLVLTAGVDAALTADFAGAGTLTLQGQSPAAPMIADFGTGDSILLAGISGADTVAYTATGAAVGVLTISAGDQTLAQLTLLGSQSDRLFTVTGTAGGALLTTQPDKNAGSGDTTMIYPTLSSGQYTRGDLLNTLAAGFPYASPTDLGNILGNQGIYVDYSADGLAPAQTVFGGAGEPAGANIEVIAPLIQTGQGGGPGLAVALQPGYNALFLEGGENISATDGLLGDAYMVGNYGADELAALGDGDTLVGATGASTTFYAALQNHTGGSSLPVDVYVHGGGNDLIATNYDNAAITTSGGSSAVFIGPSNNSVVLNGADTVACTGTGGSDTIQAQASASHGPDIIFSSGAGLLNFIGGANGASVVGTGAQLQIQGGSGRTVVWAGPSTAQYFGGSGSAIIVGGSAYTSVQGGSGAVTVFGGTGQGVFSGGTGSAFVVGLGASTVQAGAGEMVYLIGAAPVSVSGSDGAAAYGGSSLGQNIFHAGAGNETMWGGAGNDLFIAGSGSDLFFSDGGNDVFSFTNGIAGGRDAIFGFVPGQSTIALHGYGSAMPQMTTAFGDTFIHLQGGATIIVTNVSSLTAANFTFS